MQGFINTVTYFRLIGRLPLGYTFLRKEESMPRQSPYPIVLTPSEREKLERFARKYTLAHYSVMRAKLVLLAAEGLSNKDIGQRLDLPREVVSKWRRRFFDDRLEGLEDRPRPGRPRCFSPSGGG